MPISDPQQILAMLNWRCATNKFDPTRAIAPAAWGALEQALVLAPSSFGLQPWKFLVVTTPELRRQLRQASYGQAQVTDASHYVVFTGLRTTTADDVDRYLSARCQAHGRTPESFAGYRKVMVDFLAKSWAAPDLGGWNARQVYLALGQFMTAAAMMGIDTCPMEGIDRPTYDRLLGLDASRYTTLCGCAAGFRASDDKYAAAKKVRFPAAEVLEHR